VGSRREEYHSFLSLYVFVYNYISFLTSPSHKLSHFIFHIRCLSVNDAFVMDAWGKSTGAGDKIMMLADGNAQFTKALGVDLDLTDKGLGIRSRRYAMLVEDSIIKVLNLEEGGAFTISSADGILEALA